MREFFLREVRVTDGLPQERFQEILDGLTGPDAISFAKGLSNDELERFFDTKVITSDQAALVLSVWANLNVFEVDPGTGVVEKASRISRK